MEKLDTVINQGSEDGDGAAALLVHCYEEGFCLGLRCPDGMSAATSQLFTWQQIAQLLIAVNPDIFGIISEPLHQVFPQTLERLGYNVPNWETSDNKGASYDFHLASIEHELREEKEMAGTVIKQMIEHLECLGYQIEKRKKVIIAKHPTRFNLVLRETELGVPFTAYLRTNELVKSAKSDVLSCINALNQESILLRFYVDEDLVFSIEAWHPNYYEKAEFGAFIDLLNQDMRLLFDDGIGMSKYLQ